MIWFRIFPAVQFGGSFSWSRIFSRPVWHAVAGETSCARWKLKGEERTGGVFLSRVGGGLENRCKRSVSLRGIYDADAWQSLNVGRVSGTKISDVWGIYVQVVHWSVQSMDIVMIHFRMKGIPCDDKSSPSRSPVKTISMHYLGFMDGFWEQFSQNVIPSGITSPHLPRTNWTRICTTWTRKPSCRWQTRATLAKSLHGLRKSSGV